MLVCVFVYSPLVEEKLDLEREAMKRIDEAQDQVSLTLITRGLISFQVIKVKTIFVYCRIQ